MKLPRELIYEDRPSRYDFDVNVVGSLNNLIYDKWLLARKELDPLDSTYYSKISRVLNDAYFVCTVVLMKPSSEISLSYFKNHVSLPSIVYPLACVYLSNINPRSTNTDRVITMLRDNLFENHQDWKQNYDKLYSVADKNYVDPLMFRTRKLTMDLLYKINWKKATHYSPSELNRIISLVAKDQEECVMMANAIEKEVTNNEQPDMYVNDETGNLEMITPDYPEAHQLCQGIINGNVKIILEQMESDLCLEEEQDDEDKSLAPKQNLKDLLDGEWFDEFSNNRVKYDKPWRHKLIDDLLESEYGKDIISQWWNRPRKNCSKVNLINFSFVGALIICKVIKGKYKEVAEKMNISNVTKTNAADYMGSKGEPYRPYIAWLREHIQKDRESEQRVSD